MVEALRQAAAADGACASSPSASTTPATRARARKLAQRPRAQGAAPRRPIGVRGALRRQRRGERAAPRGHRSQARRPRAHRARAPTRTTDAFVREVTAAVASVKAGAPSRRRRCGSRSRVELTPSLLRASLVLGAVMLLVVARPRNLPIALPPLPGAGASLALHLVTVRDVVHVLSLTWNATLALVGLMLLSATLEANGAFRAAAHAIARAGARRRAAALRRPGAARPPAPPRSWPTTAPSSS